MQKSVKSGFRFSWLCGFFSLILITCVVSAASAADAVITVTTTVGGGDGGTVSANHDIEGGQIKVPEGSTVSFTVQANTGFYIKEVNFDSEANLIDSFPAGTFYFTVQNIPAGQYYFRATFERYYVIETAKLGAGTVTPHLGVDMVPEGANRSFTFIPDPGNMIQDVQVNGQSQGAIDQYVLNNIRDNYRIVVGFVRESFTVETSAGAGGSIAPPGITTVPYGGSITITVTPDPYYGISQVWVNGMPVIEQGPVSGAIQIPIDPVIRDYVVIAEFVRTHHVVTLVAGTGGVIKHSGQVHDLEGY